MGFTRWSPCNHSANDRRPVVTWFRWWAARFDAWRFESNHWQHSPFFVTSSDWKTNAREWHVPHSEIFPWTKYVSTFHLARWKNYCNYKRYRHWGMLYHWNWSCRRKTCSTRIAASRCFLEPSARKTWRYSFPSGIARTRWPWFTFWNRTHKHDFANGWNCCPRNRDVHHCWRKTWNCLLDCHFLHHCRWTSFIFCTS